MDFGLEQCFYFWRNFAIFRQRNWEKLGIFFFFSSVNSTNLAIIFLNFEKNSTQNKWKKALAWRAPYLFPVFFLSLFFFFQFCSVATVGPTDFDLIGDSFVQDH